jgi:hypothetical protein
MTSGGSRDCARIRAVRARHGGKGGVGKTTLASNFGARVRVARPRTCCSSISISRSPTSNVCSVSRPDVHSKAALGST